MSVIVQPQEGTVPKGSLPSRGIRPSPTEPTGQRPHIVSIDTDLSKSCQKRTLQGSVRTTDRSSWSCIWRVIGLSMVLRAVRLGEVTKAVQTRTELWAPQHLDAGEREDKPGSVREAGGKPELGVPEASGESVVRGECGLLCVRGQRSPLSTCRSCLCTV